jgi:hypothetical protein
MFGCLAPQEKTIVCGCYFTDLVADAKREILLLLSILISTRSIVPKLSLSEKFTFAIESFF